MEPAAEDFIAVANDYDGLLAALRRRASEIKMTRMELDFQAELQDGYAAKLLAPRPIRRLNMKSFGPVLRALGLEIVVRANIETGVKNGRP